MPCPNRTLVFVCREVEGLSTAETVEALQIGEEAVKTRLHRARAMLRRELFARAGASSVEAFAFHQTRCDAVVQRVLTAVFASLKPIGQRVIMRRFVRDAIITLALVGAVGGGRGHGHAGRRRPRRESGTVAAGRNSGDRALRFSIPGAVAKRAQNPHAQEANVWREGAPLFAGRCSMCHGADGQSHTDLASRMYPSVPDLGGSRVQEFSDGQLFWIIQSGIRLTGMPGFHGVVTDDDTWKLVAFIRRVPTLTPADLHAVHEQSATGNAIVMDGTRFHPDDLTVPIGTTVTFTNKDFFPHNVQSESGHLNSGTIDPEQPWSVRLDQAGTFNYVCALHPGMSGVLHVR